MVNSWILSWENWSQVDKSNSWIHALSHSSDMLQPFLHWVNSETNHEIHSSSPPNIWIFFLILYFFKFFISQKIVWIKENYGVVSRIKIHVVPCETFSLDLVFIQKPVLVMINQGDATAPPPGHAIANAGRKCCWHFPRAITCFKKNKRKATKPGHYQSLNFCMEILYCSFFPFS